SVNEKVAMDAAIGAAYGGRRTIITMKQVGMNVASDAFFYSVYTGIRGGLAIIVADDPGMFSSQNEQDNRHYARLAKIPSVEPFDSQSAYDFILHAFELSEAFDTPVLFRSTTRISHSKSVVVTRPPIEVQPASGFTCNPAKWVMLPAYARERHTAIEARMDRLKEYAETSPLNARFDGDKSLGIITSGIAYQYAREVFPDASILRLGLTYPLPEKLIRDFASGVERIIVIEELDPFIEEIIASMGIKAAGKAFVPLTGELSPQVVSEAASQYGLAAAPSHKNEGCMEELPPRPPSLCPGCPHRGLFYELSRNQRRVSRLAGKGSASSGSGLIVTGDIGCYTLGAYPPLSAMDTCACMGASIGQALGMEKAGVRDRLVAVIGDSTFMHSGLTPLANAVYNQSQITIIILDNMTTAMTGHQGHPATGISARGTKTRSVSLESVVRGMGVENVKVVDAFKINELRSSLKAAIESSQLHVLIVRGDCAPTRPRSRVTRAVEQEKCIHCDMCLKLACPAIQQTEGRIEIDADLCAGDNCGVCQQVCPVGAITVPGKAVEE
ncbi:MAG: indolepyruvate ferredoxin oxidoreductase subunit alpha, partial [Dehalococcoidaceae bacterium]|nr:indolepyruvate ferredoxin oxidoreductase subunit alpha [Dehalococcoidaceae bacterium]